MMHDRIEEAGGHTIMFLPSPWADGAVWVSCLTCDRLLSRKTTEPEALVQRHVDGDYPGVDPFNTRVLGVPRG